MVGEDYRNVQGEILMRLEELGKRIERVEDVGELNELLSYLRRLEEGREKLVVLFVNRRKNNGFWEMVREMKMRGLEKKREIEGRWLTVVSRHSHQRRPTISIPRVFSLQLCVSFPGSGSSHDPLHFPQPSSISF